MSYNTPIGYIGLEVKLTRSEQFEFNSTRPCRGTDYNEKVEK